ncbi:MAG TPA: terminase TerL endonuclease subunit [Acidimicrobiales bacterium]|nr:terminase TerL endonuclease subunit [Acidimicrobiales bacterium]
MARKTPSRPPLSAELSPEILWYLEDRGYDVAEALGKVPLIRTPEPRDVEGAVFDPDAVDRKIRALGALRHTKGKWAGQPIVPTAVQVAYIIAPVFGWLHPNSDGEFVRIIRDAYVEMPRKGAKTTLVAGLAMILGFADDEPGAEVMLGAAGRDQANAAFKPLAAVAKSSRVLREAGVRALRTEIVRDSDGSVVKTASSRGDLAHGANIHGGLVDELHVHKSPDLLEAIESGTGARRQPLVFIITTADDGQVTSIYAMRRALIEKIAARVFASPSMYGVVFAAEESDDPFVEATWAKANPLYPVTPSPEFMRSAADKAKAGPVELASFLRLHLGIRAKQDARFIAMDRWDRNSGALPPLEELRGRVAFGGLDLGSTSDLTALSWLLPSPTGGYDVLWRFWMPEAALDKLDARTQRNGSAWVDAGLISLTPGDVTDYDYVKATLAEDMELFAVQAIGYDRWNATQLVIDLEAEGAPMVKVGQGFASMSAPLKEVERLVLSGSHEAPMLRHGGNLVARWMVDNLRVAMDPSGNLKPDKAKSMDKIDGVSALVTAMAVAMGAEAPKQSIYETREPLVIPAG